MLVDFFESFVIIYIFDSIIWKVFIVLRIMIESTYMYRNWIMIDVNDLIDVVSVSNKSQTKVGNQLVHIQ